MTRKLELVLQLEVVLLPSLMESLPAEVILHIVTFLEVLDIVRLTQVSKRFYLICRDNESWRNTSFETSPWESDRRSRQTLARAAVPVPDPRVLEIQRRAAALASSNSAPKTATNGAKETVENPRSPDSSAESERIRALANWDPSYPNEKVDWYGEYIARHGPISTSWLQQPTIREGSTDETHEIRGMALHHDSNGSRVVAPLDDGSVCLWELGHGISSDNSNNQRKGAIIGRSKAGLLSFSDGSNSDELYYLYPQKKIANVGVAECLSVDSVRNKAYFTVHKGLHEVDLNTLQISHYEKYPFMISALSEATFPTPLTVGSTHSLHLHDPRRSMNACWSDASCTDRVDNVAKFPASSRPKNDFYGLLSGDEFASPFAPLFHPGPLAIHNVSSAGTSDASSGEIYVAGRFPSLLIYDRRSFPKLRNTIHSGARLCSLTSVPYPFRSLDDRDLTPQAVHQAKSKPGKTLIACGEYNGKGLLEMYGLSPEDNSSLAVPGSAQSLTYKNRVSASESKLLSVAAHGTRLVVSDGDGSIRWMERDGSTLVRRWNINQYEGSEKIGIFRSSSTEAHGDVARKLIPVNLGRTDAQADSDELLIWTGERVGVLAFKNRPQFGLEDWEERVETAEEKIKRREERIYSETMRRALEKQANEVRFVRGLGAGVRGF
ncbi:hypothetical protein MMC27_008111 [Xylographa pallens]|nr:hypothetical protein [Xylographa pallens]